jgi:hypothetical protein
MTGTEGTAILNVRILTMSYTYPTASDRILTKFHTGKLQVRDKPRIST